MLEYLNRYSVITVMIRIALAAICGGIVGVERSRRSKEAGLRTHCIISATAALLMIVSKYGFTDLLINEVVFDGVRGADPARIAAQIVSGISFLGAGVIFKNGNTVKGLTTAAGMWATGAIGMAIGAGMYIPGLFLTATVIVIQILFHHINFGRDAFSESSIKITFLATEKFKKEFFELSDKNKISVSSLSISKNENGEEIYDAEIRTKKGISVKEITDFFSAKSEIKSITYTN